LYFELDLDSVRSLSTTTFPPKALNRWEESHYRS